MRRPRARPEQQLQRSVVQYLGVALPERLGVVWFHVPNGGARSAIEGAIFKGLGTKAGVPDLAFVFGGGCFFIELKAGKGTLSPAQREMHLALMKAGVAVYTCRSVPEVEAALRKEGIEPAGRCG